MIEKSHIGPVFVARMAKTVFGRPIYFTASYFVDGLLVDTGPTVLEAEFLVWLRDKPVKVIVNTHHHEDHIGNNAVLQHRFRLPVYAFSLALPVLARPFLLRMAFYRRFSWGVPPPSIGKPIGGRLCVGPHTYEIFYTRATPIKILRFSNPMKGGFSQAICLFAERTLFFAAAVMRKN
jgi:glyoxylase-like metal-dependent hydrolase (beta-lactamase superfamily II)